MSTFKERAKKIVVDLETCNGASALAVIYGVSFDYVNHVEDGQVIDRGFRILWRKFLGQRKTSLRAAIDSAMENDDIVS